MFDFIYCIFFNSLTLVRLFLVYLFIFLTYV
nr:MAG TPA: hypothetical protein [Caudoviricetes sp.]